MLCFWLRASSSWFLVEGFEFMGSGFIVKGLEVQGLGLKILGLHLG